jgi:3D (Asp-Asp-Asp) domain-containing protein
MKRILACLATLAFAASASASASAAQSQNVDPIGDLITAAGQSAIENADAWDMKATLYHSGRRMNAHDSLGCPVAPMRTVAVDPSIVARHSIIFIKETAGLLLPDGGVHDGYWYASDIGGAIKGQKIDLFTGHGAASMRPLQGLNLKTLTVSKVGEFSGCPPVDGGAGTRVASVAP